MICKSKEELKMDYISYPERQPHELIIHYEDEHPQMFENGRLRFM
jgi:hypothetical protein